MIPWRTPARHRRSLPLRRRIILPVLTVLAALALAAGIIPGLVSASAAPAAAVTVMADRAAEFPAAVLAPVPDKTLILLAVTRERVQAAAHAAAVLAARTYTVRSGDALSSVAARRCGPARDWTGIYAASRAHRWTARNANVLTAGQRLYLACAYLPSMLRYAPAPPPPPVVHAVTAARVFGTGHRTYHRGSGKIWGITRGYPDSCGDGDGDGWDVACRPAAVAVAASPARHRAYSAAVSSTYHAASGSYQACVITRESSGNSRAVNASSGAGGLYQFLPSTWHALGHSGLAQNASVAEQNQAFQQAYAQSGTQPWSPSDGCLWLYTYRNGPILREWQPNPG